MVDARTGLKEEKYARDIAAFIRDNREIQKLPGGYAMPVPKELDWLDAFLKAVGNRYQVQWLQPAGESSSASTWPFMREE